MTHDEYEQRTRRLEEELRAGQTALATVPEIFDRNDVCRALGYEPDRGSLYRTFQELKAENVIAIRQNGSGKWPTHYRKTSPSVATADG
ncbi:MAG TPA: hypothetical protein VGS07_18780 [Thermoanaerobaculia bacterium]|jgi:hypothetical protein|nr:hypothetical protein [Thermoanaerobaculia bacterium]